jgi:hypothetical protein
MRLMKPASGKKARPRKRARSISQALTWLAVAAGVALLVWGLSRASGVAYTERDIAVVSFSALTSGERRSALQAANRERCSCGCGMTLARCVSTDMTCPLRERNIQSIRTMVREAHRP